MGLGGVWLLTLGGEGGVLLGRENKLMTRGRHWLEGGARHVATPKGLVPQRKKGTVIRRKDSEKTRETRPAGVWLGVFLALQPKSNLLQEPQLGLRAVRSAETDVRQTQRQIFIQVPGGGRAAPGPPVSRVIDGHYSPASRPAMLPIIDNASSPKPTRELNLSAASSPLTANLPAQLTTL
jgi:hypothetical protein